MEEKGKVVVGSERWSAAIGNLTEMSSNLDSLQKLLVKKAVYVDDDTFAKASLTSEQARTIKVLEQRVQTLERELDNAISAAAHARTEKRQAEAAQKAAELRAQEVTRELENTTRVFELHMEELDLVEAWGNINSISTSYPSALQSAYSSSNQPRRISSNISLTT